ncbi:protein NONRESPONDING TO OXYLIPINS 2, mitochondrial-like [Lotus japonicus]|nr:protein NONRESPONDING TO OXYLIPINS 2, mitochondrial-like [Lotus japonicus]
MASSHCTRRIISLSSLKSAIRPTNHSPLLNASIPRRRFPPSMRSKVYQLGSVQSLLPLYSAVASARMVSYLSIDSTCQALSQGTLCCYFHGP